MPERNGIHVVRYTRVVLAAAGRDYNEVRPHSASGGRAPGAIGPETCDRGRKTAISQTRKRCQDGPDGSRGLYF